MYGSRRALRGEGLACAAYSQIKDVMKPSENFQNAYSQLPWDPGAQNRIGQQIREVTSLLFVSQPLITASGLYALIHHLYGQIGQRNTIKSPLLVLLN